MTSFVKMVKQSSILQWIVLVLCFIIVALIAAIIAIVLLQQPSSPSNERSGPSNETSGPSKICLTPDCVEASAYILGKMNRSVDPCQDMYSFSCGGWLAQTHRPRDKAKWETADEVNAKVGVILQEIIEEDDISFKGRNSSAIAKMKSLYRTCMDEQTIDDIGVNRMLQLISDLGSCTMITKNVTQWDSQSWSLQASIESMHLLGLHQLFSLRTYRDPNNSSKQILFVYQSGLSLHYTLYNESRITQTLAATATEIAVLLGEDKDVVKSKLDKVIEFEKELAKINVSPESFLKPLGRMRIKFEKLEDYFAPWLDLRHYLNVMFNGREVDNATDVVFPTANYFTNLKGVIKRTDKEVLANYLMLSFVESVLDYLPTSFKKAELKIKELVLGVGSLSPRHETCLAMGRMYFGFAISAIYVDRHFPAESKKQVNATIEEIKSEFIDNLKSVTWMDNSTRVAVIDKASAIYNMIGYPDWILNVEELDRYHEDINIIEGEYLLTYLNISQKSLRKELNTLWDPPVRNKWLRSPDEVNAYYNVLDNSVVFLAAILQRPFFEPTFPNSFNYGTVGMVSGHEIIHGFDSSGRYYDRNGNLKDIWDETAASGFQNGSQCFIDQYSKYQIQGLKLNGKLTLGENIADNGGIKLSFQAYKKAAKPRPYILPGLNYTDDQLFFIAFSQLWCAHYSPSYEKTAIKNDQHTNNKYRVIGSLSNSDDFARSFNCPINSPMNPVEKCQIW
ncbi:endothelin-converting enzyme 1 [Biomphalaria pfeifferi]|uniref:Endothelin-converting enzyme 1 n=1 Tax=Biomphalaria pfeifferi TaxID=112525 RepID=A0AAD8AVY3_BIOPF|nr:endothelin-converting enzyme 1 [Biomphalaria pfeifferi]